MRLEQDPELNINLSYDPVPEDWKEGWPGLDKTNFRKLTGLSISNGQEKLEISKLMPEDWIAFFSLIPLPQSTATNDEYKCLVLGDAAINSPAGILSLLHEIGHVHTTDFEKYRTAILSTRARNLGEKGAEVILKAERDAWAYALKRLKPFIKAENAGFNTQNALTYIHATSLEDYSEGLIKFLQAELKAA